jgi:hypothetical protein
MYRSIKADRLLLYPTLLYVMLVEQRQPQRQTGASAAHATLSLLLLLLLKL